MQSRRAILVWIAFIVLLGLFNGTIPFALGADLHAWTASPIKSFLFGLIFYAGMFLAVPLILIKGWQTVRQPAFCCRYPLRWSESLSPISSGPA